MGIRQYRPTSPGRRNASVSDFADLTPGAKPEKSLLRPLKKKGGRNNQGKITTRHRGGGHKRAYRVIDFRREKDGVPARVATIEYDPNRSARIALLLYADGEKRYIVAPDGLEGWGSRREWTRSAADGGQLPAAEENPFGDSGTQHRNAARSRRAAVPQRRIQRHAVGPRSDLGAVELAERRNSPGALDLSGDHRQGRQLRSHGGRRWARRDVAGGSAVGRTCGARR